MNEGQEPNQSVLEELENALQSKDHWRALQLLQGLIGFFPGKPELLVLMGRCYLHLGKPISALLALQRHAPDQTGDAGVLELFMTIYHELYLDEHAMELARHLVKNELASENIYSGYARHLLERDYAVGASGVIADGLAKYPNSERLKQTKGMLHLKLGEKNEALAISEELTAQGSPLGTELSSLIQKGPGHPGKPVSADAARMAQEHMKSATDLLAKGDPDAAARALIAALRLDESLALAYTRLGYVYDHCGLHDESGGLHRKAIEKDPTLIEAYRNLAYSFYRRGDFRHALDTYKRALEADPGNVELHNGIGVISDKLGDHAEAISHFQQALQLNPGAEVTHRNLGFAYQAEGRVDDAIAGYEQAIKINPESPARINLATLYRTVHRYRDAKEILCAITENNPESLTAWLELALCAKGLEENGKYSEAFEKAKGLPAKSAPEAFTKAQLMELLDEKAAHDCWHAYVAMAGDPPQEAWRTSYARDRIGALGTRLGLAKPSVYIIGKVCGNEVLPSATG
jgi:tetratricopeptide (TPR) repeat protein